MNQNVKAQILSAIENFVATYSTCISSQPQINSIKQDIELDPDNRMEFLLKEKSKILAELTGRDDVFPLVTGDNEIVYFDTSWRTYDKNNYKTEIAKFTKVLLDNSGKKVRDTLTEVTKAIKQKECSIAVTSEYDASEYNASIIKLNISIEQEKSKKEYSININSAPVLSVAATVGKLRVLDFINSELKGTIKTNTSVSFKWIGKNRDAQLGTLFDKLSSAKLKCIDATDENRQLFITQFSGDTITQKIVWKVKPGLLVYLFAELSKQFIELPANIDAFIEHESLGKQEKQKLFTWLNNLLIKSFYNEKLGEDFTNAQLRDAKNNYSNKNKDKKPEMSMDIDNIIKALEKTNE